MFSISFGLTVQLHGLRKLRNESCERILKKLNFPNCCIPCGLVARMRGAPDLQKPGTPNSKVTSLLGSGVFTAMARVQFLAWELQCNVFNVFWINCVQQGQQIFLKVNLILQRGSVHVWQMTL